MIDKNLLRDIFPFKRQLIFILVSNIFQAIMIVSIAYIIAYIADNMLFAKLNNSTATPLLVLLFFFFCIKAILNYVNHRQMEKISLYVQSKLREKLLTVLAYNLDKTANRDKGQWLALVTKGVDKLDIYLTSFLPQLGLLVAIPIILLIFAFINDWISGLIFLFTAPLIPLFMILIGKIADKENKRQWALFQKLTIYMADLLPGLLVIKAYNQTQRQLSVINNNGNTFSKATLKVLRIAFLSAFMLEFISTLSIAIIAVNIGLRLLYGQAEFLPAFFILLIAPQFYQPFRQFGAAFHDAMNGITASSEIYQIVAKLGLQNKDKNLERLPDDTSLRLVIENLSYRYKDSKSWSLDNVSLTIDKGERIVLTGGNGAGKSTLFSLLLGHETPTKGTIYLSGYDLKKIDKQWWQRQIGWVAQEPYIFNTSIRENISLGRNFDDDAIMAMARLVNLQAFIQSLPEGLDTIIGETKKLSSGQKRRIGLARALIGRPKLLLLDEPMENLDMKNEQMIQEILNNLDKDITIITIGHRLQTLLQAERLIYLENGKLKDNKEILQVIKAYHENSLFNENNTVKGSEV